eukprot:CAMPEP_0194414558 /NCGR_PEP_ID=MMETSP0176-20130528/13246_1 /TAXON_ID=216777 /ORGANISM="Proboscia alata, Strain PI-D3" /LENGTH=454 /DNA_ID=CAMNT_0039218653 /DNA_START=10 /DNA_END=1375 /DNA_ORIENTATION=-
MKLFGKRKSIDDALQKRDDKPTSTTNTIEPSNNIENETVPSYFSNEFASHLKQRSNNHGDADKTTNKKQALETDVEVLLTMNHDDLNAKQRRLIRRHQQRLLGGDGKTTTTVKTEDLQEQPTIPCVKKNEATSKEKKNKEEPVVHKKSTAVDADSENAQKKKQDEYTKSKLESKPNLTKKSENNCDIVKPEIVKPEPATKSTNKEQHSSSVVAGTKGQTDSTVNNNIKSTDNLNDIATSLETLNSKDRRKLLRKLRRDDVKGGVKTTVAKVDDTVTAVLTSSTDAVEHKNGNSKPENNETTATTQLQQIEERAKQIGAMKKVDTLKKVADSTIRKRKIDSDINKAAQKKNKVIKPPKDLSHLPPAERERREHQRRMQEEAAKLRDSGDSSKLLGGKFSHPLNSERRRANRRKPGRSDRIANAKRAQKETKHLAGEYHSKGYQLRKFNVAITHEY